MSNLVGILLAAGSSSRFGSDKLLHPLPDGTAVGVAAASNLLEALPNSIAVVRSSDQGLIDVFEKLGMKVVENPHASNGMSTSIAAGIQAASDADGWVIALADMPWVKPVTIMAMTQRLKGGASIVAPEYKTRRGNPVGFSSDWKGRLKSLSGDKGAKDLLDEYRVKLDLMPTDDEGVVRDVDVKSDLKYT
jgi:molybdenum cofactor cytidylyltransferase